MPNLRFIAWMLMVGVMVLAEDGVYAQQNFPNKPIRILCGAAGGSGDLEGRLIGQGISGPLGQAVIVDARPNSTIAADTVAKSPPDGHTLILSSSPFYLGPLLQKVPYDPVNDFSPISSVSREINILVVHPSLPAKSVKELIALAKAKPGVLNYGSGSTGSSTHLSAELFKAMAGVNMARIPYKGGAPALIDLLGGQVDLMFATAISVTPQIKAGKLRALAVTSMQQSTLNPDLPTVAASGLPGYEFVGLDAVLAPAKTPAAVINRLSQEIVRFLRSADAREKFLAAGIEPVASTPEELAAVIKSDTAKVAKLIRDAGIKAD